MVANGDAPKKDSLSCHHSLSLTEVARPGFVQRPTLSYPRSITSPTHCITLHYIILSCILLHCVLWEQRMGTPTGYVTSNPFIPSRHYHLAHSIKVMHRTLFTNILNHIWQDNTKHIPAPPSSPPLPQLVAQLEIWHRDMLHRPPPLPPPPICQSLCVNCEYVKKCNHFHRHGLCPPSVRCVLCTTSCSLSQDHLGNLHQICSLD